MQVLPLEQGTADWLDARARYWCASDAPIIMGASSKMSRNDFLKLKANGSEREFSDFVRDVVLASGHEAEASARELVESLLGEELYPIVAAHDDQPYLASFDGMTLAGTSAMEHKRYNEALAAQVRAQELSPEYYWQLEHECLVSGLPEILFVVSDGTTDNFVTMTYASRPERREQLVAGWDQFDKDLRAYRHVSEPMPAAVVAKPEALPELMVTVVGEVRSSNLTTWRDAVIARIQAISTDLQTDDDFGRAEANIKWLTECEERLKLVRDQILAQTGSIDEALKTIGTMSEEMRAKRLTLGQLTTERKQQIRGEIVQKAKDALADHTGSLEERWTGIFMPNILTDFAGAIKGKKTVKGVRDAVDAELTRARLEANRVADLMDKNLRFLEPHRADYPVLFQGDLFALLQKAPDDLAAIVHKRIADHKAAEEKRAAAAAAAKEQQQPATSYPAGTTPSPSASGPAGQEPPRVSGGAAAPGPRPAAQFGPLFALSARRYPEDPEEGRSLVVHFNRRVTDGEILDLVRTGMRLNA